MLAKKFHSTSQVSTKLTNCSLIHQHIAFIQYICRNKAKCTCHINMTCAPFCVDISTVVTITSQTIAAMFEIIIHNVLAWLCYPTIINVNLWHKLLIRCCHTSETEIKIFARSPCCYILLHRNIHHTRNCVFNISYPHVTLERTSATSVAPVCVSAMLSWGTRWLQYWRSRVWFPISLFPHLSFLLTFFKIIN